MAYSGRDGYRGGIYCHEHWISYPYPMLSLQYHYTVRGMFVEAELVETYKASTNICREVSYLFQIPPEASVTRFLAKIGDTQIEAIVDEKTAANDKYKAAVEAKVDAFKLDKVNEEVFQISLGHISADTVVEIRIVYVQVISSGTLEDTVRLTVPVGLPARPGTGPSTETTQAAVLTGENAVTITVSIQVDQASKIYELKSTSHQADCHLGFADASFKNMSSRQRHKAARDSQAYVEFTSKEFMKSHFVLVWEVEGIDHAVCLAEQLSPSIPGAPETIACVLTLVSNIKLNDAEHEFIFMVDRSGSMGGDRTITANHVLEEMLRRLPPTSGATFNIYNFTTTASSILGSDTSVDYDTTTVSDALSRLTTQVSGGTNIDDALTTVLGHRDTSKPRCSIIVITDGLDWGVTAAMKTVQKHAATAASQRKLLRVFVMGLGDDVSRGMCEALARAGSGATAYINESSLPDHDGLVEKAKTMIRSISRAPIRVRSIDWGTTLNARRSSQSSSIGDNLDSREQLDDTSLGPRAKGDNLPPPPAIQIAPPPETMFWAIRNSWYAIINGSLGTGVAKVKYDIPGVARGKTLEVKVNQQGAGKLIHSLAARALIQVFEDQLVNKTDTHDKYQLESQIVRLGKTYGLASTQTSFVATKNGVGTVTNTLGNPKVSITSRSLLGGVLTANTSNLNFVSTLTPPHTPGLSGTQSFTAQGFGAQSVDPLGSQLSMASAASATPPLNPTASQDFDMLAAAAAANDAQLAGEVQAEATRAAAPEVREDDDLSHVLATQDSDGSFDSNTVEQFIFPSTGIPRMTVFISSLDGRDHMKAQIWLTTCVIAFFRQKYGGRESDWADAKAKAEKFIVTTLDCIYGIKGSRADEIYASSLEDAEAEF